MATKFLTMKFKGAKIPPRNVMSPVDRELNRRLHKLGSWTRQTARRSIRKRKKVSDPGKPPSGHEGSVKNLIFYDVNLDERNVVIGPKASMRKAVQFIEYGGEQEIMVWPWWTVPPQDRPRVKREVRAKSGGNLHDKGNKVSIRVRYEPRPFMRPAFSQELRKNQELWGDLI